MAKSMRCKREKRLRAIRREMVEPYYEKKDEAKLAAQEAALAAPKLPVKPSSKASSSMEITPISTSENAMGMILFNYPFASFGLKLWIYRLWKFVLVLLCVFDMWTCMLGDNPVVENMCTHLKLALTD